MFNTQRAINFLKEIDRSSFVAKIISAIVFFSRYFSCLIPRSGLGEKITSAHLFSITSLTS